MVSTSTGERKERFHSINPAHAAIFYFTAFGKTRDVIVCVLLATEKIAIKRQNNFRLVEMENGTNR